MIRILTILKGRLSLRHLFGAGLMCFSCHVVEKKAAMKGRLPANYVPNDDVIVVPVDSEMTFYEKFVLNDKTWSDKSLVQRQIKLWQENEIMAQQYRMDTQSSGSLYYVPTSSDKFKYLQRSYFRFLQKKGEDPFQKSGQQIINNWTANDEVNSIDEMEAAFRATEKRDALGRPIPKAFQQQQVAKTKKFRFDFQPRVEQGMIILRMTGPIFDARAWVAANGQTEVKVERNFEATGTRFFVNYYALDGRTLTLVDQSLGVPGLRARFTTTWDPHQSAPEYANERRTQLVYSREF